MYLNLCVWINLYIEFTSVINIILFRSTAAVQFKEIYVQKYTIRRWDLSIYLPIYEYSVSN